LLAGGLPDVLVSDVGMPGVDGYSLIRQVRVRGPGRGAELPAAALIAHAPEQDRAQAPAAGCHGGGAARSPAVGARAPAPPPAGF
jgi:CheY-like chemotaxis protein